MAFVRPTHLKLIIFLKLFDTPPGAYRKKVKKLYGSPNNK